MSDGTATLEAHLGLLTSALLRDIPGTRPDVADLPPEDARMVAAINGVAPSVAPPPDLFAAIEDAIDRPAESPNRTVRSDEREWVQSSDKIWKKVLLHDEITGRQIRLVRCAPGAEFPAHTHDQDEFIFMIEGEYHSPDGVVRAGDFQISRAGTFHPASVTPRGCLLMVQCG